MKNITKQNYILTHTSQQPVSPYRAGAEERISCFFYTWTPEGTSMEQTNELDESMVMSAEEQQRQIDEELEYLNSWDRVLEWL